MTGEPDTRGRLLSASFTLFRRQGYHGTGLKQIAGDARAPWGSLYHFFPGGKRDLGIATIRHAGEQFGRRLERLFEGTDPLEAIERLFSREAELLPLSDYADGCAVLGVGLDVAHGANPVGSACSAVLAEWERVIAGALVRAGMDEERAAEAASFVLSNLEGSIALARVHRSAAPLRAAATATNAALRAMLA